MIATEDTTTTAPSAGDLWEPKTPPAEVKPPAVHVLPLHLARLAEHADKKDTTARFALGCVRLSLEPDGTFSAEATDTKQLVRVVGACGNGEGFPVESVPRLATAPNGATSALVPFDTWKRTFSAAAKVKGASLGVVLGEHTTTFGTTNGATATVEQVENLQGKFPPARDHIDKAKRDATFTIRVDPKYLIELLRTAEKFTTEDYCGVTLHFNTGPNGHCKAFLVTAETVQGEFSGLLMPLTG